MEKNEATRMKEVLYGLTVLIGEMDADIRKLRVDIQKLEDDVEAVVTVTKKHHQQEYLDKRDSLASLRISETQSGELSRVSELLQHIERMYPEPKILRDLFPSK